MAGLQRSDDEPLYMRRRRQQPLLFALHHHFAGLVQNCRRDPAIARRDFVSLEALPC
jgi:hypothetical protein